MTDLTARELIDTILRSLAETRASFKKTAPASNGDHAQREARKEHVSADEAAGLKGE